MKKALFLFFQQYKILPDAVVCDNGHQMTLSFSNKIRWGCNKTSCRIERGIRHSTWFEGSKFAFETVAHFIHGYH